MDFRDVRLRFRVVTQERGRTLTALASSLGVERRWYEHCPFLGDGWLRARLTVEIKQPTNIRFDDRGSLSSFVLALAIFIMASAVCAAIARADDGPLCICPTPKPDPFAVSYDDAEALEDAHVAAVRTVENIEEAKELQAAFIINEFLESITLRP